MPRFFFGVQMGAAFFPDPEGLELAGLDEVRREALQGARDIVAELVRKGEIADGRTFVVTDERGEVVHRLPFHDAVRRR